MIAPFTVQDGRLHLEQADLAELTASLEGRPAWLVSHAAVLKALAQQIGTVTVPVVRIGPLAVLGMLAEHGCWARVSSSHELMLAREAGFLPERIAAGAVAGVADDGFVKDALTVGVAVFDRSEQRLAQNVARIAGALELEQPAATGAPPDVAREAFAGCGGLAAPVLIEAPELAIDAVWDVSAGSVAVLPLRPQDESLEGTLVGLASKSGPTPARFHGRAGRGDWVVVLSTEALAVRRPDPSHPLPQEVMVRESGWRVMEPRAFPPTV